MSSIERVYNIGYNDKEFEEFIEILQENEIEAVVDVRSLPKSMISEFDKENLEQSLQERSFEYHHFQELGGYRDKKYENYMKTKKFQKYLKKLEKIARKKKTAIMCLESNPRNCHRRYIVRALSERNFEVVHLIDSNGNQETLSN